MKVSILIFTLFLYLGLGAQNKFEGVVTYDSFVQEESKDPVQLSYWVYLKNYCSRTEEQLKGFNRTRIFYLKNRESCVLLEFLGQRVALCDYVSSETKSGFRQNLKIKIGKEKKEILGYKCKSAVLSNDQISIKVFFTEALPNWESDYMNLPGMPLEIEYEIDGMKVHHIAVDVSPETLENHLFQIPDSYEKLTQQEFQERFGTISTE